MSDSKVQFYFDKDYKIRVFDPVKFERSEEFEKACGEFVDKISGFNDKVNFLVDILETHANRIDQQKLRVSSMSLPHIPLLTMPRYPQAIGLRLAAENEEEQRRRQERSLQTMINEKKAELDRY